MSIRNTNGHNSESFKARGLIFFRHTRLVQEVLYAERQHSLTQRRQFTQKPWYYSLLQHSFHVTH